MKRDHYSLGLIGFPLDHSFSPRLHTAALQASGLAGSYALFPIAPLPEGEKSLTALLERVRSGEIQGLNVTIPHKQSVLHRLDELSVTARAIGAVNTILCKDSKLSGENTDAAGFLTDVIRLPLSGKQTALVLGAGGAAHAVVYALLGAGWQVHLAARREGQALALANEYAVRNEKIATSALSANGLRDAAAQCGLIVNTTPLGMFPDRSASPWPAGLPFPAGACVYDLIYNPEETRFMHEARAAGLPARSGLGMLVEQAALSFELWTEHAASREAMRRSLPAVFSTDTRSDQ